MATDSIVDGIQEEGERNHSFIKFLSGPDLCSESTRMIPPEFLRSVCECEDIPHRVVLVVSWDSSWLLWLDKNERGVFMEDETWEEFLNDNSLGENDVLIFTHQENLLLNVKIFKQDGVEMLSPPEHLREPDISSDNRNRGRTRGRGESTSAAGNRGTTRARGESGYERDPANPFFETRLKKNNSKLMVSTTLVKDFDLRFEDTILFIDPIGELRGETKYWGDGRVVVTQWLRICRRNRLNHDHRIICELLHTRFLVHSIRVHISNGAASSS